MYSAWPNGLSYQKLLSPLEVTRIVSNLTSMSKSILRLCNSFIEGFSGTFFYKVPLYFFNSAVYFYRIILTMPNVELRTSPIERKSRERLDPHLNRLLKINLLNRFFRIQKR